MRPEIDDKGKRITACQYFLEFTSSVVETASILGYKVLVFLVNKPSLYKEVKETFYDNTIAAGIFIGQNNDDPIIREIISAGYKVALVDQSVKSDESIYNKCIIVNADNYSGAYRATKYLIDLNHKSIAHITGEKEKISSVERVKGYKQALIDANIPIVNSLIVKSDFTEQGGYIAAKKLLAKTQPSAIFVSNDNMAIGALKAIDEIGLKVPEDISIVGFDDIEVAKYLTVPLTTIKITFAEMAAVAVKAIVNLTENNINFSANYIVPVELIKRKSCIELKGSI